MSCVLYPVKLNENVLYHKQKTTVPFISTTLCSTDGSLDSGYKPQMNCMYIERISERCSNPCLVQRALVERGC